MQKPHGRRGASTQAMQTQLLILVCKVVSQTFGSHRRQKATDDASTSGRCCLHGVTGRWHGVLQVESKGIMAVHM